MSKDFKFNGRYINPAAFRTLAHVTSLYRIWNNYLGCHKRMPSLDLSTVLQCHERMILNSSATQAEAFAVVRVTPQKTGKAALARSPYLGMGISWQSLRQARRVAEAWMACTLRYTNELRNQSDYFRYIKDQKVDEDSLDLAKALIAKP